MIAPLFAIASQHALLGFAVSLRSATRMARSKSALPRTASLRFATSSTNAASTLKIKCDAPYLPTLPRFISPASHP